MLRKSLVLCLFLFVAACGTATNLPLGGGCTVDTACATGLTCKANFVANQCTTQKTCTADCTTNADCTKFDPKGMCFQGCGSEKICMLTP